MSIRCQSSESPFNQPQHHDVCVTQCCQLLIFSDKKVRGFSKISKIYSGLFRTLFNCYFDLRHISVNSTMAEKKNLFLEMLKLETLYVCVLGFVEDPPFIRKAYKWKGKITREERKPYLAFFFAIKWIWVWKLIRASFRISISMDWKSCFESRIPCKYKKQLFYRG